MNLTDPNLLCKLCFKSNVNSLEIYGIIGASLNVAGILEKHFTYFQLNASEMKLLDRIICYKCWNCVYSFHQLYESVEAHYKNLQNTNLLDIEVKTESYTLTSTKNDDYNYPEVQSYGLNERTIENAKQEIVEDESNENDNFDYSDNDTKDDLVKSNQNDNSAEDLHARKERKNSVSQKGVSTKVSHEIRKKIRKNEPKRKTKSIGNGKSNELLESKLIKDNETIRQYFGMKCDLCKNNFETFTTFMHHYRREHKMAGYIICCDKKFYKLQQAVDHCLWHENPDTFKCQICSKSFQNSHGLNFHQKTIHAAEENRIFKCDLCTKSFLKETNLNIHMQRVHPPTKEEKRFECDICGKKFLLLAHIKSHIKQIHQGSRATICEICSRYFKFYKSYEMHYAAEHTTIDQKVQCDLCGRWLKHKEGLKAHMRFHAAQTEQCPICGRISTNKKALRSHIKTTHSPATFQCNICNKMFKRPHALREHVAVHTGAKDLYKCSFCPKTFRSNATMYKHRKQAHPSEYAENKANGSIF